MRAVWYERVGAAAEVLITGERPDPAPGDGEVRVRLAASGVTAGDTRKRAHRLGGGVSYPEVIPHGDGAGVIDLVGNGVDPARVGQRVWCYHATGTAAEYVALPQDQAVPLPDSVSFEQGACIGTPGIAAHRAVFADGPVTDKVVLVTGADGPVGRTAAQLAKWGGAKVITSVPSDSADKVRGLVPSGVDRIIEVAPDPNTSLDAELLADGGVIATNATTAEPPIPLWPLLFTNATVRLLGNDVSASARQQAAEDLTRCLADGALTFPITACYPLTQTAAAHEAVEQDPAGHIIVTI